MVESRGMSDFLTELKLARENAILGNYNESLKKYRSSVTIVQKYASFPITVAIC
jgi:hypothetical protein